MSTNVPTPLIVRAAIQRTAEIRKAEELQRRHGHVRKLGYHGPLTRRELAELTR